MRERGGLGRRGPMLALVCFGLALSSCQEREAMRVAGLTEVWHLGEVEGGDILGVTEDVGELTGELVELCVGERQPSEPSNVAHIVARDLFRHTEHRRGLPVASRSRFGSGAQPAGPLPLSS